MNPAKFSIGNRVAHRVFDDWGEGEILYVDEDTMKDVSSVCRYHVRWDNRTPATEWCVESELKRVGG